MSDSVQVSATRPPATTDAAVATVAPVAATELSLEVCSLETHNCQCQCETPAPTTTEAIGCQEEKAVTSLNIFTWEINCLRILQHTDAFEKKTGIKVNIDCITAPLTRDEFHEEILSDAKTQTGLYDGYTLGPHLYGDLDLLEGLYDLTPLIRSGTIGSTAGFQFNWNDIFMFARENGAVYDKKIVGIPIDGDVHSIYYRLDLFEKYNKTPPATWEEYTELAKFFHNRVEPLPGTDPNDPANLVQISGSCVGKMERTEFWVFLILSSMTQFSGTTAGNLFDHRNGKNMEPLLGEAFVKTLQFMEEQFVYGADNEYDGSFKSINIDKMNQGVCAMTYMWGDAYTEAAKSPPESVVSGYIGTAFTPGSKVYLNRDTHKLEPCTAEICSCGNANFPGHEDDSCINSAPYAAFTGWAGACSNFTSASQKEACAEFFGYISSSETSIEDTIPNVTVGAPFISVDPYRNSQMVLSDWVERGLPENSTRSYIDTVQAQLQDVNVALDMRIPSSAAFQSSMNSVFRDHLRLLQNRKDAGLVGEEILSTDEERWETEREIRTKWRNIITDYDNTFSPPLLEAYQRNLGIFSPIEDTSNDIGIEPIIGIAVGVVAVVVAAIFCVLREKNRKNDDVWKVDKNDLKFEDPPVIIGRGKFGLVLMAEYRGTDVAVKRVLPASDRKSKSSRSTTSSSSADPISGWFREDVEANAMTGANKTKSKGDVSKTQGKSSRGKKSGSSDNDGVTTRRRLVKDFKNEMRLLSQLRHPSITTAVGAVVTSIDDPMLVMEYMQHGSLYDILHNETMILEGDMLLQILCDISQGVRYLHSYDPKVIHCDLKSSNILVDSRFRAKVADFGLAIKDRTNAVGTPYWMAPELLEGRSTNTAASDVYAFGIILYEVFSRKEPYDGEDSEKVLNQVCDPAINKRPPTPINCPPQINSMMCDCLVYDPEERPTFEELDNRLKRVDVKHVQSKQESNNVKSSVSLLDIFPRHIAEALRQGKPVEAEHKDMVTIFFSDIVGFTEISSNLEPRKIADMLGRLYDALDKLSNDHDIFKVETIGDAYMAVTNLVKDQSDDHVKRIAEFAADAIEAANSIYIDKEDPDKGVINIRVGFHSGPVVADVVGSLNPRYCLFGDSVNTSSRMESHSEVNRIHCSEASAKLLLVQAPHIPIASRGMISVKGKGLMHTYWVNNTKPPKPEQCHQ